MIYYRQCQLRRTFGPTVSWLLTSWIPEKYAKKGKVLNLKDGGTWENGWEVIGVYARIPESELPYPKGEIEGHKDATGDSLPKGKPCERLGPK